MSVVDDADAVLAVVAHGLIDATYPVLLAGRTLQRHDLPAELRDELVAIVVDRSRIVVDSLHDLLAGRPPNLVAAIEAGGTRDG